MRKPRSEDSQIALEPGVAGAGVMLRLTAKIRYSFWIFDHWEFASCHPGHDELLFRLVVQGLCGTRSLKAEHLAE